MVPSSNWLHQQTRRVVWTVVDAEVALHGYVAAAHELQLASEGSSSAAGGDAARGVAVAAAGGAESGHLSSAAVARAALAVACAAVPRSTSAASAAHLESQAVVTAPASLQIVGAAPQHRGLQLIAVAMAADVCGAAVAGWNLLARLSDHPRAIALPVRSWPYQRHDVLAASPLGRSCTDYAGELPSWRLHLGWHQQAACFAGQEHMDRALRAEARRAILCCRLKEASRPDHWQLLQRQPQRHTLASVPPSSYAAS
mmetsp:Transcript_16033/g.36758  ORF Transcript_16033/g.36758 Transcript_16033/m.36758 type:complete len:256 (-) Transcript_16033:1389-2156(-)